MEETRVNGRMIDPKTAKRHRERRNKSHIEFKKKKKQKNLTDSNIGILIKNPQTSKITI